MVRSAGTPGGAAPPVCGGTGVSKSALGRETVSGRVVPEVEIIARHGTAIEVARGLAEMDVVVAANSACPSDIIPTNAHHPTPRWLVLYEPDPGAIRAPR
jgi:hypothetical protein